MNKHVKVQYPTGVVDLDDLVDEYIRTKQFVAETVFLLDSNHRVIIKGERAADTVRMVIIKQLTNIVTVDVMRGETIIWELLGDVPAKKLIFDHIPRDTPIKIQTDNVAWFKALPNDVLINLHLLGNTSFKAEDFRSLRTKKINQINADFPLTFDWIKGSQEFLSMIHLKKIVDYSDDMSPLAEINDDMRQEINACLKQSRSLSNVFKCKKRLQQIKDKG